MTRLARLLLALFLAFTVPVQAMAGITMAACGGHAPVVAEGAVAHHSMDHDALEDGAGHHHSMGDDGSGTHDHQAHKCGACAACCNLSPAPALDISLAGALRLPAPPIPFLEVARASLAPDTLERPPRSSALG